jgi:hypothetical protein
VVHPAVVGYSEELRREIAEGPLFDQTPYRDNHVRGNPNYHCRPSDGNCVYLALSAKEVSDGPIDQDDWKDLIRRNDRGDYAVRANLRRDLLGEAD